MNTMNPITDLTQIDRAVISAATIARDFASSEVARHLTPAQLLVALTIAAVDVSSDEGLAPDAAAAKLRNLADALSD